MGNSTRLNTAMQAVDVFLEIDGQAVRAIIPRAVFEKCLHSESSPGDWLKSYQENASIVDDVIRRKFAAKPQELVVVRSSDFTPLED